MVDEALRGLRGLAAGELLLGVVVGFVAVLVRTQSQAARSHLDAGPVLAVAVALALRSWPVLVVALAVAAVERTRPAAAFLAALVPLVAAVDAVRPPAGALLALVAVAVALAAWRAGGAPPRTTAAAVALSAFGWYGGLPDTEAALAFLGAALALLVYPPRAGWGAAAGVAGAVVVFGAAGRTGAVLGGVLCFGMLLVPGLLVRLPPWPVLAAHGAVVAYASRVVSVERDAGRAAALGAPVAVVLLASGVLLAMHDRSRSADA